MRYAPVACICVAPAICVPLSEATDVRVCVLCVSAPVKCLPLLWLCFWGHDRLPAHWNPAPATVADGVLLPCHDLPQWIWAHSRCQSRRTGGRFSSEDRHCGLFIRSCAFHSLPTDFDFSLLLLNPLCSLIQSLPLLLTELFVSLWGELIEGCWVRVWCECTLWPMGRPVQQAFYQWFIICLLISIVLLESVQTWRPFNKSSNGLFHVKCFYNLTFVSFPFSFFPFSIWICVFRFHFLFYFTVKNSR